MRKYITPLLLQAAWQLASSQAPWPRNNRPFMTVWEEKQAIVGGRRRVRGPHRRDHSYQRLFQSRRPLTPTASRNSKPIW